MDNRYSSIDNTSPTQADDSSLPKIQRSKFDFSCVKNFNAIIGALMPFDVIRTIPNESYSISYDTLITTRNPLVRALKSGMRCYIHTYYNRCSDLWEGAKNFFSFGRSGSESLQIPKLYPHMLVKPTTEVTQEFTSLTPLSPSDYMGLPIEAINTKNTDIISWSNGCYLGSYSSGSFHFDSTVNIQNPHKIFSDSSDNSPEWSINALPFVMYQKIARDFYINQNVVSSYNSYLFPKNEDHFILPYDCSSFNDNYVNVLDYDNPYNPDGHIYNIGGTTSIVDANYNSSSFEVWSNGQYPVILNKLRYRQWKGDYFSTASIFPDILRGTTPTLDLTSFGSQIDFSDCFKSDSVKTQSDAYLLGRDGEFLTVGTGTDLSSWIPREGSTNNFIRFLNKAKLNITQNALRELEAITIFRERMARGDGTYNSLIRAQFGISPRNSDRTPQYLGGCYQDIVFNDVVNTSKSDSNAQLGYKASNGISASSGFITDNFFSPDYGYIMSIMCIVPDTYYAKQGLNRDWTEIDQKDIYFPILNGLAPQPILQKELYISVSDFNSVFGYTDRYAHYKSRENSIHGLGALVHGQGTFDTSQYIRRSTEDGSSVKLNTSWLSMTPKNIDMSVFTSVYEPPFDIQVASKVIKISPMPYVCEPTGV